MYYNQQRDFSTTLRGDHMFQDELQPLQRHQRVEYDHEDIFKALDPLEGVGGRRAQEDLRFRAPSMDDHFAHHRY